MKALIRNKYETVLETDNIPCIDWNTGAPLTNREWSGGPYTLVRDYVPEDDLDFIRELHVELIDNTKLAEDVETVTINGKECTVEEAREILGVKL